MNFPPRSITLAAGLLGFLGVALGAFGAHALKPMLVANGHLEYWEKAVLYQLIHSVALLALAGWSNSSAGPAGKVAACWVAGILFFSGSLYALALGGPIKLLWPVTPLGGLALLAGWGLLILTAWKRPGTKISP